MCFFYQKMFVAKKVYRSMMSLIVTDWAALHYTAILWFIGYNQDEIKQKKSFLYREGLAK